MRTTLGLRQRTQAADFQLGTLVCYNSSDPMRFHSVFLALAVALVASGLAGSGVSPGVAAASRQSPATEHSGESIPVTSPVVRRACGSCHQPDAQGRMTRISYQRTTPEGWQQTIRRMVLLNNLQIETVDAREAVRYLANNHGLAPAEARPAAFEVERRLIDYQYTDQETQETCTKCHSMGRVISQRRTPEEWELLTAMHRGYYPLSDFQAFRRRGRAEPGPDEAVDRRQPVEKAVAQLSEAFPLITPEWTAWSANMRSPRLAGTWALVGHQLGMGPVFGEVVTTAKPGTSDEFETRVSYTYARTGERVTRTGQAIVYTGFQWRGRSTGADPDDVLREVMFVERGWQEMSGRWYAGAYDEIGLDVTLSRVGAEPVITGIFPRAISTSASQATLQIHGANLPTSLAPADVDLGPGLEVTRLTAGSAAGATVEVTVEPEAAVGVRDLFVGRTALTGAVAVFDEIGRITVAPATGMARVGGVVFPKQFQQFEARAYHDGPDGASNTDDDLDLGVVDVAWSLEEYAVTFGDDDTQFVGRLDSAGLFTPAVDGPNPERQNEANNIGDVWAVATLTRGLDGSELSRPLRARAHLLVTVPRYVQRGNAPESP